MPTIKVRRGVNAALPAGGTAEGEPRFSTDTKQFYIDDGNTNTEITPNTTNVTAAGAAMAAANLTANALIVGDGGAKGVKTLAQGTAALQVINLKPVVNADVNKLDVFSKSGGAAFDATNYLTVSIPDGNGYTSRTRNGAVASGTGQIILADATNYWSKGSLANEIKTAYLYAIWSTANGGIVFALNGYSGFTRCPASVTATDDDYMHLEASSSYTPVVTDYCVAIAKIRYSYATTDTPDHAIQATAIDAPQVCWNPKSDYGYSKTLATTNSSSADIADYSALSIVVKQSQKYKIHLQLMINLDGSYARGYIKTGSATYGSAVQGSVCEIYPPGAARYASGFCTKTIYLNVGDTIHGGATVLGATGNRILLGDSEGATFVGATMLTFSTED